MYTTACPDFNPIDLLSGDSYRLEKKHIPKTKKIDAATLIKWKNPAGMFDRVSVSNDGCFWYF
jgi:hypothetical protein